MNNYQKIYWQRARGVAKLLELTPFIRLIGLNGSLTRGEAKAESDIDFYIACKPGRLFTCRAFATILAEITGLRRSNQKIAGMICLNRYATTDFLEIFPHNRYHANCFSKLYPLFDAGGYYEKYRQKNLWMNKMGFKFLEVDNISKPDKVFTSLRSYVERFLSGRFGNWLERKFRQYQTRRILSDPRTKNAPPGRVRVSNKELCFHPDK